MPSLNGVKNTVDCVVAAHRSGHLVGMQAQTPHTAYVGLWDRLEGFRGEGLSDHLLDRSVVRMALMRGTIHLVTAEDALAVGIC